MTQMSAQSRVLDTAVTRPRPMRIVIAIGAFALLALVLLQIYLGALVAGLRAGLIFNTWPLIDGSWVPDAARMFFHTPLWRNFFENALTVQFNTAWQAMGCGCWRCCMRPMSHAR